LSKKNQHTRLGKRKQRIIWVAQRPTKTGLKTEGNEDCVPNRKMRFSEAKSEAAKIQDDGKPAPACEQLGAQPDQELNAKKKNQGQHCDLAAAARKKNTEDPRNSDGDKNQLASTAEINWI
jgi:hypothetical protein